MWRAEHLVADFSTYRAVTSNPCDNLAEHIRRLHAKEDVANAKGLIVDCIRDERFNDKYREAKQDSSALNIDEMVWEFRFHLANKLWATYEDGYAFPMWCCMKADDESVSQGLCRYENVMENAKHTRFYCPSEKSIPVVKRLAFRREPCNIQMRRRYDKNRMQVFFGWETGEYNDASPNFAVACKTPFCDSRGERVTEDIDVINLIGYAFDHRDQPDYKKRFRTQRNTGYRAFLDLQPANDGSIAFEPGYLDMQALLSAYYETYRYAFEHARYMKRTCLALKKVGTGAFAPYWKRVHFPLLKSALMATTTDIDRLVAISTAEDVRTLASLCPDIKKELLCFAYDFEAEIATKVMDRLKKEYPDIEVEEDWTVPTTEAHDYADVKRLAAKKAIFVNAWDPWSFVGNGNAKDESLDGAFGRATAMALLCSPIFVDGEFTHVPNTPSKCAVS